MKVLCGKNMPFPYIIPITWQKQSEATYTTSSSMDGFFIESLELWEFNCPGSPAKGRTHACDCVSCPMRSVQPHFLG